ncbi:hypothetical protein IA539_15395 [Gordonia sp. zg691]|uniref:hypothetical protein n=1 Tax=Gordonia jinghuaiqii TaxID=2758710 RepID=UPI0016622A82|nr:hypothetical protein [Gordonia jinghuaiqii]MBD0862588.1 hypothetical protein [Gordonia jinghuaiqii]
MPVADSGSERRLNRGRQSPTAKDTPIKPFGGSRIAKVNSLNALLSGIGDARDFAEVANPRIIENSSARPEAGAAGPLVATVIHDTQYDAARARRLRRW